MQTKESYPLFVLLDKYVQSAILKILSNNNKTMKEESRQLYFDADYTSRAIADGIKPTREYITVGELEDERIKEARYNNAGWVARNDPDAFEEMTRERDLIDLQEYNNQSEINL